jgi:hypothetical protein
MHCLHAGVVRDSWKSIQSAFSLEVDGLHEARARKGD